jgi:hypothetical protein
MVFSLDGARGYPGAWAIIPVMGAVFVIWAGSDAWFNRVFLSSKLAVWLGVISYPLYLWHWPLLSFARIVESEIPSQNVRWAAVAAAVPLAWLTFRFVERPVRIKLRAGIAAVTLVVMMATVGCAGYAIHLRDGLGFRAHAAIKGLDGDIGHMGFHKYVAEKYFLCTPDILAKQALTFQDSYVRCMQSKPGADVEIAIVGDSHAEHLFLGVADALSGKNVAFYIKAGAPLFENPNFTDIFKVLLESKTIKTVILTMYWAGRKWDGTGEASLASGLVKVVDALTAAHKKVYLTDDVPTFPFEPEKCQGKRWLATKQPICGMDANNLVLQSQAYMPQLTVVAKQRHDVRIIPIGKYFCDQDVCSMTQGDKILYRDNNHLNINGRRLVKENAALFD